MLTRLLVLWLLSEQPQHGYRIKKILDDEALRFWFPVEYASIYAVLRSLVRGGLRGVRRSRARRAAARADAIRDHARGSAVISRSCSSAPGRSSRPSGIRLALALAARSDLEDERPRARAAAPSQTRRPPRAARAARGAGERSAPAPEMVDRQACAHAGRARVGRSVPDRRRKEASPMAEQQTRHPADREPRRPSARRSRAARPLPAGRRALVASRRGSRAVRASGRACAGRSWTAFRGSTVDVD